MGLHVFGPVAGAQVREDLRLITRRQQRGQQDDVWHARVNRCDGAITRVDDDQFRVHAVTDHAFQDGGLALIGLEGKNQRDVIFQS